MKKNNLFEKNVLVTGANGFVGRHLVARLKKQGANVYGISRTSKDVRIYNVDIVDLNRTKALFKKLKIQMCFHLAGVSLVEEGQEKPYETLTTNIIGSLNLLEITRLLGLERLIIASTAHVYGDNVPPFKETFFPRPSRPYETSKANVDLIAQSYADTFNLPVLICRFVNIYGPFDTHELRLIPKTIKSILSGQEPEIWGGDAVRDYLYIDDAIDAYIKLAFVNLEKIGRNKIFNFGSGNKISVSEIVEKLIKISKKNTKIKKIEEAREQEISEQFVSFDKAKKILAWRPKVKIDLGLRRTYKWHAQNVK